MKSIILCILISFCSLITIGQTKDKSEVIDSLLQDSYENGIFNGVALVADEGEVILHKAYGFSDREAEVKLELSDRFYIGSLTKQFTAVLILQLQEQGFLDITSPLSAYIPEFNNEIYGDITIHQLLTHTSGLNNYTSYPEFDSSKDYTEREMIKLIKTTLLFEPGTKWNYSNSGFYTIGSNS